MADQDGARPSAGRCEVLGLATGALGLLLVIGTVAVFMASTALGLFPRMRDQQSIRAFEAATSPMPKGTVPFEPSGVYTSAEDASALANPVPDTPGARERGAAYYGFYCGFCHGDDGRGDTPVGAGYLPHPGDLGSPRITQMTDGELCAAMVKGKGHGDVLAATVPTERRWYIVRYLRGQN